MDDFGGTSVQLDFKSGCSVPIGIAAARQGTLADLETSESDPLVYAPPG